MNPPRVRDLLLDFWALFAAERGAVAGGTGLSSRPTPLSFANGVWRPEADRLDEAVSWCRERGLPPAALVPPSHPLAARGVEAQMSAVPLPAAETGSLRLEQVGWQHTRPLAELIAYRYDRMDIEEELVATVTAAMEREPHLEAYLAYQEGAGEPFIGGALAWATGEGRVGSLLIWAEERSAQGTAAAVAARHPERLSYHLSSAHQERAPDEHLHVVRVKLDT